jgi:hypothetical protein
MLGIVLGPIAAAIGVAMFVFRARLSRFVTREPADLFPFLRRRLERKKGPTGIGVASVGLTAIGIFFFIYGITNGFGAA